MSAAAQDLAIAVSDQHGVQATLDHIEGIDERFQGNPVWQGIVHVFRITGHPQAKLAYAWSHSLDGSDKRRVYTVLGVPPINSARDAVRAAIVAEARSGRQ